MEDEETYGFGDIVGDLIKTAGGAYVANAQAGQAAARLAADRAASAQAGKLPAWAIPAIIGGVLLLVVAILLGRK